MCSGCSVQTYMRAVLMRASSKVLPQVLQTAPAINTVATCSAPARSQAPVVQLLILPRYAREPELSRCRTVEGTVTAALSTIPAGK